VAHNAFPGFAVCDNGDFLLSYRAGSGHATGVGVAKVVRSTDRGATWGTPSTVYSGADDFRDCVVTNTPSGLLLTGFDYTGTAFPGLRVHRSLDDGFTWSQLANLTTIYSADHASSAPIVALADGTLIWPTYGLDPTPAHGIVKVLASTDGGTTWTVRATLSDGTREYVEPNIAVLSDGTLLMMIRSDGSPDTLFASTSTDDGVTWSTPASKFTGASGKPAVLELWGRVHLAVRSAGLTAYAYSDDQGATWTNGTTFGGSSAYVYAAWADTGGLRPSVCWAEELSLSDANLYFRRVPVA
jgi:hypothetical protein